VLSRLGRASRSRAMPWCQGEGPAHGHRPKEHEGRRLRGAAPSRGTAAATLAAAGTGRSAGRPHLPRARLADTVEGNPPSASGSSGTGPPCGLADAGRGRCGHLLGAAPQRLQAPQRVPRSPRAVRRSGRRGPGPGSPEEREPGQRPGVRAQAPYPPPEVVTVHVVLPQCRKAGGTDLGSKLADGKALLGASPGAPRLGVRPSADRTGGSRAFAPVLGRGDEYLLDGAKGVLARQGRQRTGRLRRGRGVPGQSEP
jgi:hypothetical protein